MLALSGSRAMKLCVQAYAVPASSLYRASFQILACTSGVGRVQVVDSAHTSNGMDSAASGFASRRAHTSITYARIVIQPRYSWSDADIHKDELTLVRHDPFNLVRCESSWVISSARCRHLTRPKD